MDSKKNKEIKYLVSAEEMKQYDENTIQYFGLPGLVLMERAALSVAEEIIKRKKKRSKVLVVAGCGNNGGDGIAAGRILMQQGFEVTFCLIGQREKCSRETESQLAVIEKYGCMVKSKIEDKEYDIIIDALFGIGLTRKLEGIFAQAAESINQKDAFVCSVDIPSGIHADTGEIMGIAVRADITVTFAFEKLGHIQYPGCAYAGKVICRDIGITEESFRGRLPHVYTYGKKPGKRMPARDKAGNKGTFGKVLVIAGSTNMSGACELCARSSYGIGAGMVKVVTPETNREIIQGNVPEALLTTYGEEPPLNWEADMQWADCVVIGPGLGKGTVACELLKKVLRETQKALVIDADGINLLADSGELKAYLEENRKRGRNIVLTPHVGEFSRLCGCTIEETKRNKISKAKGAADRYGCVMVLKDARTVVADSNRDKIYLNTTGNDGMATAGMGDVLAGVIGGLLAQGMPAVEAATVGVYVHGAAGDRAEKKKGRYALTAGDVIKQLGKVTRKKERHGL